MTPTTSLIYVGLFALISLPLETKALDLTECADDYGIAESDSLEVIQQKMMIYFGANCPLSGPISGTPGCCFITPPLTRITADAAFDAIQNQSIDGNDGVIMIDVRTSEEVSLLPFYRLNCSKRDQVLCSITCFYLVATSTGVLGGAACTSQ